MHDYGNSKNPETKTDDIDKLRDTLRIEAVRHLVDSGNFEISRAIGFQFGDERVGGEKAADHEMQLQIETIRPGQTKSDDRWTIIGLPTTAVTEHVPGVYTHKNTFTNIKIRTTPEGEHVFTIVGDDLDKQAALASAKNLLDRGTIDNKNLTQCLEVITRILSEQYTVNGIGELENAPGEMLKEIDDLIRDTLEEYNAPTIIGGSDFMGKGEDMRSVMVVDGIDEDFNPTLTNGEYMLQADCPYKGGQIFYFYSSMQGEVRETVRRTPPESLPEITDQQRSQHPYVVINSRDIHTNSDEPATDMDGRSVDVNYMEGYAVIHVASEGSIQVRSIRIFPTKDEAQLAADRMYQEQLWRESEPTQPTVDEMRALVESVRTMSRLQSESELEAFFSTET